MPLSRFRELSEPFIQKAGIIITDEGYLLKVLEIVQEKIKLFKDVPDWIGYFFTEEFPLDPEAVQKTLDKPGALDRLIRLRDKYAGTEDWSAANLEAVLKATWSGTRMQNRRVGPSGSSSREWPLHWSKPLSHVGGHGQTTGSATNGPGAPENWPGMSSLTLQTLGKRKDPALRLLVIGDPIDHSLSPPMHNEALRVFASSLPLWAIARQPAKSARGVSDPSAAGFYRMESDFAA